MSIDSHTFARPLVERVLRNYFDYEWTAQGFGMIRTYLGPKGREKQIRLNVWDSRVAVPGVSTIHDHPWDFSSLIVAGVFTNLRYTERNRPPFPTHDFMVIKTGVEGDNSDTARRKRTVHCIYLMPGGPETYTTGDVYHQHAHEIHESLPLDGTVTINERIGDTGQARVFWAHGTSWVDAKPRVSPAEEVRIITRDALAKWF